MTDIRWVQRYGNFKRALESLKEAHGSSNSRKLSVLERLGMIRLFELTYELSWKVMKDFLQARGVSDLYGSRDAIREAFRLNLVTDGEPWMKMIQTRNLCTHTYDESTMTNVLELISDVYLDLFVTFSGTMEHFRKEEA